MKATLFVLFVLTFGAAFGADGFEAYQFSNALVEGRINVITPERAVAIGLPVGMVPYANITVWLHAVVPVQEVRVTAEWSVAGKSYSQSRFVTLPADQRKETPISFVVPEGTPVYKGIKVDEPIAYRPLGEFPVQ